MRIATIFARPSAFAWRFIFTFCRVLFGLFVGKGSLLESFSAVLAALNQNPCCFASYFFGLIFWVQDVNICELGTHTDAHIENFPWEICPLEIIQTGINRSKRCRRRRIYEWRNPHARLARWQEALAVATRASLLLLITASAHEQRCNRIWLVRDAVVEPE